MDGISSLIPSSDNLYKFLFMGGIFLIVFSFLYPLEKKQAIEVKINTYYKNTDLLSKEIKCLSSRVDKLQVETDSTDRQIERLKFESNRELALEKENSLNAKREKSFLEVNKKLCELDAKNISLKYDKQEIELLNKQVNAFNWYRWIFLAVGTIFTIFGIIKWYMSVRISDQIQIIQRDKLIIEFDKLKKN